MCLVPRFGEQVMPIWEYAEVRNRSVSNAFVYDTHCMYCRSQLERDYADEEDVTTYDTFNYGLSDNFSTESRGVIGLCPGCGWWKYAVDTRVGGTPRTEYEVAIGSLKELDFSSGIAAVSDVRDYLVARYNDRYSIHPRLMEEVVASIYKDHGYDTCVTSYSGDGGIDVILRGPNEQTVGIQVKRYRNKISASQIRELVGALVINGHTKGVFITTSEFQSGALTLTRAGASKGVFVELVDGAQFLEKLKIAQLSSTELLRTRSLGET
jgi:restriction system protein